MSRKNKIIVSVVGIVVVLLALLGLTYAYYLTRIQGNTNTNSISVTTAKLELVYGDGSNSLLTSSIPIEPGKFTASKDFTVTNNGNVSTDYAVTLEDFSITYTTDTVIDGETFAGGTVTKLEYPNDMKMEITCVIESDNEERNGKDCGNINGTLPIENSILLTNSIEVDDVHKYVLILTYLETGTDQSKDMNKTIKGKIDIIDPKATIDLTGNVANYQRGDYVEINSTPIKSEIVDGKYKIIGVEPGNHTLNIKYKDANGNIQTRGSQSLTLKKGKEASISGNTIIFTEELRMVKIDIEETFDLSIAGTFVEGYNMTYAFKTPEQADAEGVVKLAETGNYTFYWADDNGVLSDWTELAEISDSDTLSISPSTLIPTEATKLVVYNGSEEYAEVEIPKSKISTLGDAEFSFVATGDFHKTSKVGPDFESQSIFLSNLESIKNNVDFVVMNGDIFESLEDDAKNEYLNLVNNYELPKMYYVNGNHDYRKSDIDINILNNRSDSDTSYFSMTHKGVKFIFSGPTSYVEGDSWIYDNSIMTNEQLKWLKNEISSTPEDTPIYLFTHIPLHINNLNYDIHETIGGTRYPFENENEIYYAINTRTNLVSFSNHTHHSNYYKGKFPNITSIIDNNTSIDGITCGSIKDANEFSVFSVYEGGNKLIRTTYVILSEKSIKKVAGAYSVDILNNGYSIQNKEFEYETVKILDSSDIKYGKVNVYTTPYIQENPKRAIYNDYDIELESGYTYKFEFTSSIPTAQMFVVPVNEITINKMKNSQIVNVEDTDQSCGWRFSGWEYEVPTYINNSPTKTFRIQFRMDESDSNIENDIITSVTISRARLW